MANKTGPNRKRLGRQWLHKMGMNSRLEGRQRLAMDNFLREVVPQRKGIWIKRSTGQGQTAKGESRALELRFRRFGRGWGLNGFGDEHKPWTILNKWQRVAMSRRMDIKGRSDSKRNLYEMALTWFKAVGKGFYLEGDRWCSHIPGLVVPEPDREYSGYWSGRCGKSSEGNQSIGEISCSYDQPGDSRKGSDRSMPRNLTDETRSIGWFLRCRIMSGKGSFLVEITMDLVLAALAASWLLLKKLWIVLMSPWKSDHRMVRKEGYRGWCHQHTKQVNYWW